MILILSSHPHPLLATDNSAFPAKADYLDSRLENPEEYLRNQAFRACEASHKGRWVRIKKSFSVKLFQLLSHLSILKTERSLSQRQSRSCLQRKIFENTQKTKLFRFAQYFQNWINATELNEKYASARL